MSDLSDFEKVIKISAVLAANKTLDLSRLDAPGNGTIARLLQLDRHWWSIFNVKKNKRVRAAINAYVAINLSNLYLWEAYSSFKVDHPNMKIIQSVNDPCFSKFLKLFHYAFRFCLAVEMKEGRDQYETQQTYLLLSQLPASGTGKGIETLIDLNYEYKFKFDNEFYLKAIADGFYLKELCEQDFLNLNIITKTKMFVGFEDIFKVIDASLLAKDKGKAIFQCNPAI